MWVGFTDLGICQLYFMGPSNKVATIVYYSYIQDDTLKFGWSYTLGLLIGVIVHPDTIT